MALVPQKQRLYPWLAPLAGILVFLPTLWYSFVWDDQFTIVNNTAQLGSLSNLREIWFGPYDTTVSMFRPISSTLLFLQYHLFQLNPLGYHLTSILLHAIACVMVYLLARQLSPRQSVAVFASLLFAVHTIHIEAIAWVSTLAEPVVDVFILAGLLSYIAYRRDRAWKRLAITCSWLFAGLLIKETAITLPFFILAYEFTMADRNTRTVRSLLATFLSISATVFVYIAIRIHVFKHVAPTETQLPFSTLLYTWPSVFVFYLKKLLLPVPTSPFYDQLYVTSPNSMFWLPIVVLLIVAVGAFLWSRYSTNGGLVRFCFWAMLIGVLPVLDLNVFQWREIAHDRFLYLSSVFFCVLIAQLLFADFHLGDRAENVAPQTIPIVLAAALAFYYAAALLSQLPVWKNDISFYYYAHRMAPQNPRPAWGLAQTYLQRGDLPQAEKVLTELVQLLPAPKAFEQLAEVRMRLGDPAAAEDPLRQAIRIAPERLNLHLELAESLKAQGRVEEAQAELAREQALRTAQPSANR